MQLPSHLHPLHAAGLIIRPLKTEDQKFSGGIKRDQRHEMSYVHSLDMH